MLDVKLKNEESYILRSGLNFLVSDNKKPKKGQV